MLSDVGLVRALNEDSVLYIPPQQNDSNQNRGGLALVADGMGGHAAGEVASAMAAEIISRCYFDLEGSVPDLLTSAFKEANREILKKSESNTACKGMGTTCTALAFDDRQVWLAHIGDSRAYLLRDGELQQLSEDQSLVAQMVQRGELSEEEAENSPMSSVILQALGTRPDIVPIIWKEAMPLLDGDVLLLCSDGLSNMVPSETIADIAGRLPPYEACQALINAALEAGGQDNVSLGIFSVVATAKQIPSGQNNSTRRIKIANLVADATKVQETNGRSAAATRPIVLKQAPNKDG
jgi:protein phosphatase